eukprot:44842-Pelagomonas_calceolata.AAC.8
MQAVIFRRMGTASNCESSGKQCFTAMGIEHHRAIPYHSLPGGTAPRHMGQALGGRECDSHGLNCK